MMHSDYKAEGTEQCRQRFGPEAQYDWPSDTCWVPIPLPTSPFPIHSTTNN